MWKWRKKTDHTCKKKIHSSKSELETIKQAVRAFAQDAPEGITTRVLVKDDHRIDFHLLKPYLHEIPSNPYYMSKETYEIFEEKDKSIPYYIDIVQQAVDQYVEMYHKLPIVPGDPYKKVSYLLLEKNHLIKERPPIDFYITDDEYLITHQKPQ